MTAMKILSVLKDDGTSDKKSDPALPADTLLTMYRHMVTIRRFDERMLNLQRQGAIGFFGMVTGQEGAIVGSGMVAQDSDWIVPALREGYLANLRGLPMHLTVAQYMGNGMDIVKGRQMPCHLTWKKGHYVAMSSVIGTQISHATGIAMAAKFRKDPAVVLGYLGDGATSANDFHCGLNFAAVWKAPVVFVCQNNQWSISVPFKKQTATATIAEKAVAYGMRGVLVDGNDALAVYAAVKDAADRARSGEGPTLVEARTYRILGHSSSDDPTKYRDEKEVKEWEKRDPIARFKRYLVAKKLWDEKRDAALKDSVNEEINAAVKQAEAAPMLEPGTLVEDVYGGEMPEHLKEQQRDITGG